MKKHIVVYYSRKGNNRYLANKIADKLNCKIVEIKPRLNAILFFVIGMCGGIKPIKHNFNEYENVILCGPIFMGKFISPLKAFIQKYKESINNLVFVTCCGSGFEMKNDKFGHGLVFNTMREVVGDKLIHCEAFPTGLVLSKEEAEKPDGAMKVKLSDDIFTGDILTVFDRLIDKLKLS